MAAIKCVGLIPAETDVNARLGLNVLVMAVNAAEAEASSVVRLFGAIDREQKLLTQKECTLSAGEHAHLYFHIPPRCFSPDFWDGEEPEEMTIYAGLDSAQTSGDLVFIQS